MVSQSLSMFRVFLLCFSAGAAAALGVPRDRGEQVSWHLGGVADRPAVYGSVLSVSLFIVQVCPGHLQSQIKI